MAYIGLRKPIIGKRNEDGTYETPFRMAKAISVNITPNYAEGSLYADDELCEYEKEFVDADVTMGTNTLPIEATTHMFGHKLAGEAPNQEIVYHIDDESSYVGCAFVGRERVNGKRSFVPAFLPKAKFSEPASEYETKGNAISFKTPSITGKASADDSGIWKETAVFETEAEALAWINKKFGVKEEIDV